MAAICLIALAACAQSEPRTLGDEEYLDRVYGAWTAMLVANHSGLPVEGQWIDEPGPPDGFEFVFLDQWSTDDDTHVEWLNLHILETHGLAPTYEQIRDEWVDHLNGDIWVSTRAARDLMDEGLVPPATSDPERNPDGAWSIDAQLQTEVFGLLSPGRPDAARKRARFFALVTNRGPAVDASAFYTHMIAEAFFDDDVAELLRVARNAEPDDSLVASIVDQVTEWHDDHPDDWRRTRRLIRDRWDTDPEFWGSRVNFAATVMALLYGDGDVSRTIEIAALAGWDADNNMAAAATVLGTIVGYEGLPATFQESTDVYFNEDLTNLDTFDSVRNIAARTAALGRQVVAEADR